MTESIAQFPPDTEHNIEKLKIVYEDMGARLSQDNDNSWKVVTLASVLLTLLGVFIADQSVLTVWGRVFLGLAAISYVLAMVYGFVSLLLFRDLRRLPLKRIFLDIKRFKAFENNPYFINCDFHTRKVLSNGTTQEAQKLYLNNLLNNFDSQFVNYIFWLANTIETKKKPRILSLIFVFLGSLSMALVFISRVIVK